MAAGGRQAGAVRYARGALRALNQAYPHPLQVSRVAQGAAALPGQPPGFKARAQPTCGALPCPAAHSDGLPDSCERSTSAAGCSRASATLAAGWTSAAGRPLLPQSLY